jgi:membrane-associated phospholipid phosphatase
VNWALARQSIARPYRVPVAMVVLVALVPFYIFLPELFPPRTRYAPEIPLDRAFPIVPVWSIIYGALYLFLIVLPIFVVRDDEHVRRSVNAYLFAWIAAYVFFMTYPTIAPRPEKYTGDGFAVWGLEILYSSDPPYNCFPSLHVAHSFISALTVYRLHRPLGVLSIIFAALVALSTLFTKQHYVVDVIAGIALAAVAYAIFLRGYSRERVSSLDERAAPALATALGAFVTVGLAGYWIAYLVIGQTHFEILP